ncbi:MAG: phosphate-selective porin [Ferruginibacter sp.]|nr:phosphate-selective porin [Ferruginibacter sp.]
MVKRCLLSVAFLFVVMLSQAQFLMDMVDTSTDMGKSMLGIYKKFDRVKLSGYVQPQYQVAQEKGQQSFNGGDFAQHVDNRFMLRRGRVRIDYIHFAESKGPSVQFVFQFDGSEKGFFTRDFWGRVMENRYQLFSLTAGLFARPFSYELNLGSADRESPERGRMSQILTKVERDLGAMVSFEPRKKDHPLSHLKIDAGFFNGPGLNATADFDSYKDFISRVAWKPVALSKHLTAAAAVSYFNGSLLQNTRYRYETKNTTAGKAYVVDSSLDHLNTKAPRKYYGADAQVKISHGWGVTELRAEMVTGTQTGSRVTSETPAILFTGTDGYYLRKFNGAYFYLLQNIVNNKHQLGVKYDWYDPNRDVEKMEIGAAGTNFNAADVKYSTLSIGYNYYVNENLKLLLWYDKVMNEKTALPGMDKDLRDDVFTCRLQFRF